ncbi:DUF3291 domain-containing protein [Microbulbifer aggregans]|uniref:DUF3291 domain-containing protein n=1 Tax=Microbulbifer aggregans TaxID=1769779 RepID=UPI001CFC9F3E|nr:DUF3291 domain-containing protein [Microbulbifer aggregans]
MASYHLAQVNIAYGIETLDHPVMAGFVAELDRLNALADISEGFIWRLQSDEGDATAFKLYDDEKIILNMSVWESIETLKSYVYSGEHLEILKQKKQWFEKTKSAHLVLWWVPAGEIPSIEDVKSKLSLIQKLGPSEQAFNFARAYPAPDSICIESERA